VDEQLKVGHENELVSRTLAAEPEAEPATRAAARYIVFEDNLETEAAEWRGFVAAVQAAREEQGDWRPKSDDAYRRAAESIPADPPQVFIELLARVRELVS
jgi:hypothetical protein